MTATTRTRRIVPALVLSVAVIGSAGAGSAVAAKMITGKDIKNNTVASADLKNNSVASVDLKNNSVTGGDLKNGSVQEADLAPGVKGKLNKPSVNGYEVVKATATIDAGSSDTVFVACTSGKVAVGGGGSFANDNQSLTVQGSLPFDRFEENGIFGPAQPDNADAWGLVVFNGLANLEDATAYVICVDPS